MKTHDKAYEAKDGSLFLDKDEAKSYDAALSANGKLMENEYYYQGGLGGITQIGDLIEFLKEEKDWILPMMKWEEK